MYISHRHYMGGIFLVSLNPTPCHVALSNLSSLAGVCSMGLGLRVLGSCSPMIHKLPPFKGLNIRIPIV